MKPKWGCPTTRRCRPSQLRKWTRSWPSSSRGVKPGLPGAARKSLSDSGEHGAGRQDQITRRRQGTKTEDRTGPLCLRLCVASSCYIASRRGPASHWRQMQVHRLGPVQSGTEAPWRVIHPRKMQVLHLVSWVEIHAAQIPQLIVVEFAHNCVSRRESLRFVIGA